MDSNGHEYDDYEYDRLDPPLTLIPIDVDADERFWTPRRVVYAIITLLTVLALLTMILGPVIVNSRPRRLPRPTAIPLQRT